MKDGTSCTKKGPDFRKEGLDCKFKKFGLWIKRNQTVTKKILTMHKKVPTKEKYIHWM